MNRSATNELAAELENDLALVMLIEKRHAARIGSRQARDLIARVKDVLKEAHADIDDGAPPLNDSFNIH